MNNSPVINQGIEPGPKAKNITNANVEIIANMPLPSVELSESSLSESLQSVPFWLQSGTTSFFSGFEIFKEMVGEFLGYSNWKLVTQKEIDNFVAQRVEKRIISNNAQRVTAR